MMKLDDVKKLQQKKFRQQLGAFLVEGEHLVLELQKAVEHNPALATSQLFLTESYAEWPSAFSKILVSEKQMKAISDTKSPQGIIAVVPMAAMLQQQERGNTRAVYLHEVQDPGNLGTILRTLGWFGGFSCLLSPESVDPFNPKVVRASMGAIFHVPIELDVPLATLTERFSNIGCLDLQGQSLQSPDFKQTECFVFGNEARGVPREQLQALSAVCYTIPGSGQIESLNLASAVNMCVYELNR